MECDLCREKDAKYNYVLDDGSSIGVCEECGDVVYGKNIRSHQPSRLFQIIAMMEYVAMDHKLEGQKPYTMHSRQAS